MPDVVGAMSAATHLLDVNLLHLAVSHHDGAAILASGMESKVFRIVVGKRVTIHASVVILRVLDDGLYVEVGQVSLINAHSVPTLIAWRQQTIGYPGVNLILGNMDNKGFVSDAIRMFFVPDTYGNSQR